MSDYQIQPNKKRTLFYITYRTKKEIKGYKKNYVYDDQGAIVSFDNEANADKYATSLRARADAKNDLKALRLRMNKKYGNHNDFLDSYLIAKKKAAPKSFTRSEWHMVHYVFPYFLYEKKKRNANSWALYFDDFKDWIEESCSIRKNKLAGGSKLSISSINKIIGDLNGYLDHLYKKRHLLMLPPKCEYFTGAEDGYRNGDDVVEDEEYHLVIKKFDEMIQAKSTETIQYSQNEIKRNKLKNQIVRIKESKSLYIICRRTGMRISEALGLSFGDFFPKTLDDKNLNTILSKNNLKTLSYIVLKSQLGIKINGKWKREPLKTKNKISDDNARTIPIFSSQKDCDLLLKNLHVETRKYFNITTPDEIKKNEGQCLFFRNINKNIASAYLKMIYDDLDNSKYKWKSYHCLRHTRATEIISETHDQTLLKLILGHKSRVYERYVHLESTLAKKLSQDHDGVLLNFKIDDEAV